MPPLVGLCVLVEPLESVLLFLCLKTLADLLENCLLGYCFIGSFFYMRFDVL